MPGSLQQGGLVVGQAGGLGRRLRLGGEAGDLDRATNRLLGHTDLSSGLLYSTRLMLGAGPSAV
jgi:hypothetical protein